MTFSLFRSEAEVTPTSSQSFSQSRVNDISSSFMEECDTVQALNASQNARLKVFDFEEENIHDLSSHVATKIMAPASNSRMFGGQKPIRRVRVGRVARASSVPAKRLKNKTVSNRMPGSDHYRKGSSVTAATLVSKLRYEQEAKSILPLSKSGSKHAVTDLKRAPVSKNTNILKISPLAKKTAVVRGMNHVSEGMQETSCKKEHREEGIQSASEGGTTPGMEGVLLLDGLPSTCSTLPDFPVAGVPEWRGRLSNKTTKASAMASDSCLGSGDYDFSHVSPGSMSDSCSKSAKLAKFCADPIPGKRLETKKIGSRTKTKGIDESQQMRADYSNLKRKRVVNLDISPTKTRKLPRDVFQNADLSPDDMLHEFDAVLEVESERGHDISSVATTRCGDSSATGSKSTVSYCVCLPCMLGYHRKHPTISYKICMLGGDLIV